MFQIEHLDHVAIRVKDIEKSITWYEKTLLLKTYRIKEWGSYPVFMLAGRTGIALFPENEEGRSSPLTSLKIYIDHFAFAVTPENFEKAKKHYSDLGINYSIQDHTHFHSIYTKDPDGHVVELTTFVGNEKEFFGNVKNKI